LSNTKKYSQNKNTTKAVKMTGGFVITFILIKTARGGLKDITK
jgi:hypothetical protein